jgi:hypothetical protein
MAIFKTFEAKLHGVAILSNPGDPTFVDNTVTFSRSRIRLKEYQKGKLLINIMNRETIQDGTKYELSREYNSNDVKVFIITMNSTKITLSISKWNKIKTNIIHEQYWIQNNMDTFYKALLAIIPTIIGGVIVGLITYKLGFSAGLKEGQSKAKSEQILEPTKPLSTNQQVNYPDTASSKQNDTTEIKQQVIKSSKRQ